VQWTPRSAVALSPQPRWGTWPAHPALAQVVSSYWWVRGAGRPTQIKVLPDASADITFDLSRARAPRVFVAPSVARPTTYPLAVGTWLFGARVAPAAASLLIGRSLASLPSGWTPLETFLGRRALTLCRKVAQASDDAARAAVLDAFFLDALLTQAGDPRLRAALAVVFARAGAVRVEELARACAVSERTLGRLFVRWVGLSPKTFVRIVRFQHALRGLDGAPNWAALAAELGYFDQAHLIRDMRALFGAAPTAARAVVAAGSIA
jgi:AraC-like DNA-binding protein